ncbi:MAG: hypothetical protein LBB85_06110 [Dysgonamonadaceae bacterium]|jgi:hypothetical protein|nr:hypothetical protein [Dysgonamonadaceae bacterium]
MKAKSVIVYLFALGFLSCNMEDLGNYDYQSPEEILPVEIEDLNIPSPIQFRETWHYEPVFKRLENEERYSFRWYVIYTKPGVASMRIDLCNTKILHLDSNPLDAGSYDLYFEVKDTLWDIFVKKYTRITVSNSILNEGWYILKDDGENTDIDYFVRKSYAEINPAHTRYENVIQRYGFGAPLPGKALSFAFISRYACNENVVNGEGESVVETYKGPGWLVQTDQTIVSTTNTFSRYLYSDFADNFYDPPAVIEPQGLFIDPTDYGTDVVWMLNKNMIYSIYLLGSHIGKFSQLMTDHPLDFYPEVIWSKNHLLAYEQRSGVFCFVNYIGSFTPLTLASSTVPNIALIANAEVAPVRMLDTYPSGITYTTYGLVLLKHKTLENKYYLAKVVSQGNNNPFTFIKELPAAADILRPDVKVMAATNIVNAIYYAKNENELWIYTDNDEAIETRQQLALTYPKGEKIVYIRPIIRTYDSLSWVCVLTNTAEGGYNLYVYDTVGATADLLLPEKVKLSGTGNAKMFFPRFY